MRRAGLAIWLLTALPCCGEVDGSQPFAGTQQYRPTDGAYTVRYLSPPWLLVVTSGEQASFAIAPTVLSVDLAHATVLLEIQANSARAAVAAPAALLSWIAAHPGGTADVQVSVISNANGQRGLEWSAQDFCAYHREVYFDGAKGSFSLVFDGHVPLDGSDVSSFIAGFSTGTQ